MEKGVSDMKQNFYISLGGEHKIYTFWQQTIIDLPDFYKDIWTFWQNLAIDPDEAYKKAKKLANGKPVIWDVDGDSLLNKYGIRASNKKFDGETLTWGKKFLNQKIADIVKDSFGIKYLAFNYGFPQRARQCDLDCLAYTSNLPEVKQYLQDLENEEKRKENLAKMLIDNLKESEHIGEINETLETDVTVTGAFWIEGYYGSTFLIKMIDEENNRLSCFTTSKAFIGNSFDDQVKANDRLKISGIVKRHEIRDERIKTENTYVNVEDVKTTLITRIKKGGE